MWPYYEVAYTRLEINSETGVNLEGSHSRRRRPIFRNQIVSGVNKQFAKEVWPIIIDFTNGTEQCEVEYHCPSCIMYLVSVTIAVFIRRSRVTKSIDR